MDSDIELLRPEPIVSDLDVIPFTKRMDPRMVVDDLVEGRWVLVKDFFSSGLLVLRELKNHIGRKYTDASYEGQRRSRAAFRELTSRLLLQVRDNRLLARKSPEIGWLKILYPDVSEFLLPYAQVQGLNSAWQWYQKGVSIPVLKARVFPFYGTYFPTRFEHLLLFDQWLREYQGSRSSAIDVGVGSGVITYQLVAQGVGKVYATDSNPNAIHGMREALDRRDLSTKVELFYGDLFADCGIQADLIVFNPPWLPLANDNEGIDKAMYYDENLFLRFFAEAVKHLKPDGRLVLLFSNLARITNVTDAHPIADELKNGGRFEKETRLVAKVSAASKKTRRNQNWREEELVELWVLKSR